MKKINHPAVSDGELNPQQFSQAHRKFSKWFKNNFSASSAPLRPLR